MGTYKFTPRLCVRATTIYSFGIEPLRTNHDTHTTYTTKIGGNGKYWQGVLDGQYVLSKRTDAYAQIRLHQHRKKRQEKVCTMSFGVSLRHRF